jgi:hypothetical protein
VLISVLLSGLEVLKKTVAKIKISNIFFASNTQKVCVTFSALVHPLSFISSRNEQYTHESKQLNFVYKSDCRIFPLPAKNIDNYW